MQRTVIKKEKKQERLLEAAFHLLTHKDIHDVSISEIAKEAGIAKGTFYLYFKDKYDLRDFLVHVESRKILDKALSDLEHTQIRSFVDSFIFVISSVLDQLESNPLVLSFIRYSLPVGIFSSGVSNTFKGDDFNLIELFRRRAEEFEFHYENPDAILFMVLQLATSVCYNALILQIPCPMAEIRPYLFDSVRAILMTGAPEESKRI